MSDPFDAINRAARALNSGQTILAKKIIQDSFGPVTQPSKEAPQMANAAESAKKLLKTKTFWTGVAGLATAAGATAAGEMSIAQAIQTGITCLIGIFLRSGMVKLG